MNEDELLYQAYLSKKESHFDIRGFLFNKQLDFVSDPSPFKVAVCSRRSGKTVACAADLISKAMAQEGVVCLYITLSRNNAKKIIWPEIQKINRAFKLGGSEDNTELSMRFPNGSIIYLSGAKDAAEIQKFRGLPIKLVYIDECQSFREYIRDLIDDILAPALMDYAGSICLIGTPAPVPTGFFHECAVETDTWSKHGWNFFDNPFISQKSGLPHQQLLDRELKRRGVEANDPSIQREWFGKWSLDLDSLLLHYTSEKNHYDELPPAKWNYIMGIDLGFVDADAIGILAWSESRPETFLVEECVVSKQGLTELVSSIQNLTSKYPVSKMVIDEGGLGKKIAEEIRRRHQIPVQPADKIRKMENIAFLNDALRTGRFKAKKNSQFAQDSFLVEIDRDKTTPDRIRIKDGFHSDIIDAVLYAFKESPAFGYQVPAPQLKPYTKPWFHKLENEMEERAFERAESILQHAPENEDDWVW